MLSMAMWMVLVVAPLQIAIGDAHGLNTLEHQPAKIAALEGHWENKPGESVPLILFGLPDMAAETTRYAVEIPHLGSLILTHDLNGRIPGLKEFAPGGSAELDHRVLDLPRHGRARHADAAARPLERCGCAGAGACIDSAAVPALRALHGASGTDRDPGRLATRPRSAASPGWSMASCAPRTRSPTIPR